MGSRVEWRVEGRRNRSNPRLDDLRSEAGGDAITGAAGALVTVFTVPTGKVFHVRNFQIYLSGAAGVVTLYTSTGAGTRGTLFRNALSNGATRAVTDLVGWRVIASTSQRAQIVATATGGRAFIRVGGIIRSRHAGETTTAGTVDPGAA